MVHPILKKAEKSLPAKTTAADRDFITILYQHTPGEDLELVAPHLLAETALRHRQMSLSRKQGEIKIEIYTPPLEKDEWSIGHTVVNIVMDDMSFLVDSVAALITKQYKLIHVLIHPILHIQRDKAGKAVKILNKPQQDTQPESHMHIELQGTIPPESARQLKADLLAVLRDVGFATRDWVPMRNKLRDCQEALHHAPRQYKKDDIEEYLNFLEYLYNDNFTLLGFREYRFSEQKGAVKSQTVRGSSLGLLHDDVKPVYIRENDGDLPPAMQEMRRNLPPLTIAKVNKQSTVHRPVPLDAIAVKRFDKEGKAVGEYLFIGLFTSVTYSRSIRDIPLLRHKTDAVMGLSGFKPGSHNYKALRHILEKYPRDELLQIEVKALFKTVLSILRLQERQRIALYMRPDLFGRYVSCLVYVPRDRYDTKLRTTFQSILEQELDGQCASFHTTLDDSPFARVLYVINISQSAPPKFSSRTIEKMLQEAGKDWSDRLATILLEELDDEEEISRLAYKYGAAFPGNYQQQYNLKQTFYDIRKIEQVLQSGEIALDLYHCNECDEGELRLKIYHGGGPMILSSVMPLLENMGLEIIAELPFKISPHGADQDVWVHDFLMRLHGNHNGVDLGRIKDTFEEAFSRAWYGTVENDTLNELVLRAGLDWRKIMILRTYVRYMRQMRYPFGTRYIEKALTSHPHISAQLAALFAVLHCPAPNKGGKKKDGAAKTAAICKAVEDALEKVDSLDEDRIIRSLTGLIEQTLRTNAYQHDEQGEPKSYISIKLNSGNIDGLPSPRPYREIFVYARRMEGIHLRGDVIARGGIRWSDRHEDFRTEVLGLMKAQQVKNAVIVPMGAKGGFVVKDPPTSGGREALLAEGIECYKTLVRGLLDITDNRKGSKVLPPPDTVCRDDEDPYLVVAADKGTASFSDIANGLSAEYGFWLGDAFASGGSAGYDHKVMGITARGAWESVKRHFRELGHDTQSASFDVTGVGDMAGDVFGNGMLLSPYIRLVGAFNHVHIFCDPDPDPKKSFKERERLFKAVKGWDDYDTKLLSKGGRIYSRRDKALKLTPQIMERFEITKDTVTPAELITALLRANTDLLWFGGIGTYIKASSESHADVGDKANDMLRINASELRAKVIGEGANLAVTQLARIEFAKAGGRINADFIDNSGGVDSSDHEVNIKILMNDIMAGAGHNMDIKKRNKLLEKMTDEVAALVLRNNYQQTLGLSLMAQRAAEDLPVHSHLIRMLEHRAGLDRALEHLPDEEELQSRAAAGTGLTRPELGIVQAYAKILLSKDLLACDVPDKPEMQDYWLVDYFPEPLRKPYHREILRHRLHREIVATTMSNSLINRMGATFVKTQIDKTGTNVAKVLRAYMIVRDSFALRPLWDEIEGLDTKVPATVQLRAMNDIARIVERSTTWFLTRITRPLHMENDIRDFGTGVRALQDCLDQVITEKQASFISQRTKDYTEDGLPAALARQVAISPLLGAAYDVIKISLECKTDIATTARTYFKLGEYFQIDWLRDQARHISTEGRWSAEALGSLTEQLHVCQAGLTVRILGDLQKQARKETGPKTTNGKGQGKAPANDTIESWLALHPHQAARLDPFLNDLRKAAHVDLPMLIIAEQRLRHLYGG